MSYAWEEVKHAVERHEDSELVRLLSEQEVAEGYVRPGFFLIQRAKALLEVMGGIVIGLNTAVVALVLSYLLFIWILHVNFDW